MLVHEDEEKLEEKKELKVVNLHRTRQKKYEKKIKGKSPRFKCPSGKCFIKSFADSIFKN
jgi:hypothetical protein